MTNHLVNSELRKFRKSLSDLLSTKIVQKLTYDQKRDVYKEVLARLFNLPSPEAAKEASLSKDDKLFHFDLMKETLIKIGKLASEKFKQIDVVKNDDEEIKLIKVLSDAIDHPITLPYLIPNLCECTLSSIELLFRHLAPSTSQKLIKFEIDETFDKKLNDRISEKIDEKFNASKPPPKAETAKKIYKVYSNKTSEYYESKRVSGKMPLDAEDLRLSSEKKLLEKKIDEIASESNKMHQLNEQYRRNKEDLQDELVKLRERCHKLMHESEEKSALIEEKQSQFEGLEIELNTIKVQLESIYKQNQLLDSDKLNLSSNASNLQRKVESLERQNGANREECAKLKEQLSKREDQIKRLEREFDEKRSSLDRQQLQIRRLIEEEQTTKRQFEQLESQEREIKFKYEKVIKELETKQKGATKEADSLKEEVDGLKAKLDEKVQENFKLNLELKDASSKMESLKRDRDEDEELLKRCREDKAALQKKLELNAQELARFKKLNLESNKFIEDKTAEVEQLQADLASVRNENIEMTNKLHSLQTENSRQLELVKKSHSNELKQKARLIDELNQSLNDLRAKLDNLNDEKRLFVRLFGYMEKISDENQQLPTSLNDALKSTGGEAKVRQQASLQFEHYLDLVKELKSEFKCRQLEIARLKESNKLVENEYEEQKNFLQSIQQKLASNVSQLKIKDCELIHLRDELAECRTRKNEDELEKLNLQRQAEGLKSEKSSLELLNLELKQKIANCQLRNVELENQLQINLNKIIELERFVNELNEKQQQLNESLNETNERLVESSSARDHLARELDATRNRLKENEKLLLDERALNQRLNENTQKLASDRTRLEQGMNQLKSDNQQLEFDLDRIEKEFKDYESRYKRLIDERAALTDLVNKYNIILKSHLNPALQLDENCLEFATGKSTSLKLVKPECLMQSLLELQDEQSKLRRQVDSLKTKVSEQRVQLKEESELNRECKALIEFNENNLLTKRMNYERLFKEQKDFKVQLEQTLEENERLKIEKNYLTEKVLSLDRILESVKEFMERKFEETCGDAGDRLPNVGGRISNAGGRVSNAGERPNVNRSEPDTNGQPSLNLEDMEIRLIYMHDSLTEFIDILMKKIGDYKEQIGELSEVNAALNARLDELNRLLEKRSDKEQALQVENESLKKELIASSHDSKEVDNKMKRLTNRIAELQDECSTLQNSLESNR